MKHIPRRPWLVYFASGNYWKGNPTGRHHLLWLLRDCYRIVFINSMGLANIRSIRKKTLAGRVWTRMVSTWRYLRRDNGFIIFSPVRIPLGGSWGRHVDDFLLRLQFRAIFRVLGIRDPYVLVSNPSAATALRYFSCQRMMYLYSDRFVAYREITNRAKVEAWDQELRDKADVIVTNLRKTADELSAGASGDKVHYIPHAVDFEHFHAELARDTPLPPDIAAIPSPRIGYYGTLTDSNDWEMMEVIAKARPRYHFIFIGRARADVAPGIRNCPNVHFLGYKLYQELPRYLKGFDVCVMFWKMTEWIYHSSPLKTKEFLAMGKPIVSVPIYELVKNYGETIYFAENHEDFVRAIDKALSTDSEQLRKNRIAHVRGESWEAVADRVAGLLEG